MCNLRLSTDVNLVAVKLHLQLKPPVEFVRKKWRQANQTHLYIYGDHTFIGDRHKYIRGFGSPAAIFESMAI